MPAAIDAPEEKGATSGFVRWVLEIQNHLVAFWERLANEERKAYKAEEDARFRERTMALRQRVLDDFNHAKEEKAAVVQNNLDKAELHRAERTIIKEVKRVEEKEQRQYGAGLVHKYGVRRHMRPTCDTRTARGAQRARGHGCARALPATRGATRRPHRHAPAPPPPTKVYCRAFALPCSLCSRSRRSATGKRRRR
jgi:hypothetical protein